MKRTLLASLLICSFFLSGFAQNIQLHYDFGDLLYGLSRPKITTTVEKFHPDGWGSTFFFVDMDYTSQGVASAYWEISRELTFWEGPLSAHIEYNGGLSNQFSYNNAWLAGATYTFNNASFTKGYTLSAMYKHIQELETPYSFQITGTWYINSADGLYSFTGFADWWLENDKLILLSEPQFWVNLNKLKKVNDKFNLSVGTEVKLSHNFIEDEFYLIPTLALKWTLD